MYRTSKKSPSSTTPKRTQSAYRLAAAAVIAAAKANNLTCSGWLKTHPSDPCRKTALKDSTSTLIGYGYCGPSGTWWLARGKYAHGPVIAQGDVTVAQAELSALPVTPTHTILATAAIGNRHEKALVAA